MFTGRTVRGCCGRRVPSEANEGVLKPRRLAEPITGYGLWHPFAALAAGAHQVFWLEFSSVLPERYLPVHSAVALRLWTLGCRGEDPAAFDYARHAASLELTDPVDAFLWRLWWARSGRCGWEWVGGAATHSSTRTAASLPVRRSACTSKETSSPTRGGA